jgi:HEAT repeat protein
MNVPRLALLLLVVLTLPAVADDVDRWIQDLKDPNPNVRIAAADALFELNDTRAVGPLIQALKDNSSYVRQDAAGALGEIGEPVVDPLIPALKDNSSYVRSTAAGALEELNDSRAVNPLTQVLNDKNEEKSVQDAVAEALKKLSKPVN